MYLFKDLLAGVWIFGQTPQSECPAGIYRLEPSLDGDRVSIRHTARDIALKYAEPLSSFLDKDGVAYPTMEAFLLASRGFFSSNAEGLNVVDMSGNPTSKPDVWDTLTSATVVYEGYKSGASYRISKTDLTAETRKWATGEWADRIALIYE